MSKLGELDEASIKAAENQEELLKIKNAEWKVSDTEDYRCPEQKRHHTRNTGKEETVASSNQDDMNTKEKKSEKQIHQKIFKPIWVLPMATLIILFLGVVVLFPKNQININKAIGIATVIMSLVSAYSFSYSTR
uniref:Uncharacterized protein n=1 Tax=Candidatus Kentrum sp. TC TaxID=2126339 RepID=A0A450ZEY6_9GAMM|nr:MAG: hypothetical protein BECKTC1821D_GA0114238_11715 [Candidatus Kentron sp. TC]